MSAYAGSARIASIAAETGATETVLAADAAGRPVELDQRQVAALARVLRRRRPRGPQAQRCDLPSQRQLLSLTDREMRRLLQRCVECLVLKRKYDLPSQKQSPSQRQLLGLTEQEMRRLLQRCVECLVGASNQHDRVAKEVAQLLKRK